MDKGIRALACVVAVMAVIYGLFLDRGLTLDEAGLYNPIYQWIETGRMTYPAHNAPEAMYVHPPTHYYVVGAFHALGLALPHAAGIPLVLLAWLTVTLVLTGRFSDAVKAGLLYGLGVAFLWIWVYSVRPDLHLALAWYAGLVALETGRLGGWDWRRLLLGSALLTYASALHYPALAAWLGVGAYAVWALWCLHQKAVRPVLALVLGGLVVGVPYLLLFVVPHWKEIAAVSAGVQGSGGIVEAVARHTQHYATLAAGGWAYFGSWTAWALPTLVPMKAGIPLAVLGPALLAIHPTARGIALAALPHLLFLYLASQGKGPLYYTPEVMLYCGAVAAGLIALCHPPVLRIVAVGGLAVLLVWTEPLTTGIERRFTTDGREMDVSRAASRSVLGPGALVGATSAGLWYTTGADRFFYVTSDLIYPPTVSGIDLGAYFARFDAVALDAHSSGSTYNRERKTLSAWYADGTLGVRGFWFGDRRQQAYADGTYLLLSAGGQAVAGHAYLRGRLSRFDAAPSGDWLYVAQTCPYDALWSRPSRQLDWYIHVALPPDVSGETRIVKAFLVPRRDFEAVRTVESNGCEPRDEIPLARSEPDREALLTVPDVTIRFLQDRAEVEAGH